MPPNEQATPGFCGAQDTAGHMPEHCANCMARHLAVCAGLNPEQMGDLAAHARRKRISAGQNLFQEGDIADHVFTVTSGAIKEYKLLADGRCQVTGFYFTGDLIGMPEGADYPVTAEALTEVTVCAFPRPHMMNLVGRFPELAGQIILKFQGEVFRGQEQMLSLGRLTAEERIAGFLLNLMDKAPESANADGSLSLQMKRADIADYLGLTVETVSRSFTKLRNAGVIETDHGSGVVVPSRERLEQASGSAE